MRPSTQRSRSPSPDTTTDTPFLRDQSPDTVAEPSTRWFLTLQARILRFLARIGFYLHSLPKPTPSTPSFFRYFTTGPLNGPDSASLQLAFYVPVNYYKDIQRGKRYPVVVNYHGGGFTLGRSSDDARWATAIVRDVSAVVVGVTYRLAPEHPFPTAVEDGLCSLLYLSANAEGLGIDARQMTLSGFSAGGNLTFTVPLRLHEYALSLEQQQTKLPPLPRIVALISWYPSVDNRLTRDQRRANSVIPSKTLPPILTHLFDASYFPHRTSVGSPYASPAAASDGDLAAALPDDIAMYLCEWDMLLREGEEFQKRLEMLGKRVRCEIIKERKHAFDKRPSPFKLDWKMGLYYKKACDWLYGVYGVSSH